MRQKISGFRSVLQRELKIMMSDLDILVIILLSPLFYGLFYGSAYMHKTEVEVPVIVVDQDHSALSRQFIRDLQAHQLIRIVRLESSLQAAQNDLQSWQAQAIVWIPREFEHRLKQGKHSTVKLYLNASRFLPANDINRAVQEVVATMDAGLRIRYLQRKELNFKQALKHYEPLRLDDRNLFSPALTYGDFLIPGILVLILQQTLLFGLAMSIARETETNGWRDLYQRGNGSVWAVMSGKSFPYFVLYTAYSMFFFTVYFSLFRLPFRGNFAAFLLLTVVFLITVIYLSVFVGTLFERKIIALQFLVFTSYPVFLLSGFSWPVSAMPVVLQWITQCLPTTPYLQAMSRITAMGANIKDVFPEIFHLLLLGGIGLLLTRVRIKYYLNRTIRTKLPSPLFNLAQRIKR